MRIFLKNKKGQNTAEYAILIAIVVAAVVAMQTYVKRSLQGGIKFVVDKSAATTSQYEPYYLEESTRTSVSEHADTEQTLAGGGVNRTFGAKTTTRSGSQKLRGTSGAN